MMYFCASNVTSHRPMHIVRTCLTLPVPLLLTHTNFTVNFIPFFCCELLKEECSHPTWQLSHRVKHSTGSDADWFFHCFNLQCYVCGIALLSQTPHSSCHSWGNHWAKGTCITSSPRGVAHPAERNRPNSSHPSTTNSTPLPLQTLIPFAASLLLSSDPAGSRSAMDCANWICGSCNCTKTTILNSWNNSWALHLWQAKCALTWARSTYLQSEQSSNLRHQA